MVFEACESVFSGAALVCVNDGAYHIGRVTTHRAHRRRGLAGALMRHAMSMAAPPIEIKAQAHLADWYATFGFVPYDAEFVEDGIPHQRMRIDA